MTEKQGFDVANYNLTPAEAGQAAQVNELAEALADGFQLSEDAFPAFNAGRALVEGVLKNTHSKEAVIVYLVKMAIANIFDELAERTREIAERTRENTALKKEVVRLNAHVVKLKASARS